MSAQIQPCRVGVLLPTMVVAIAAAIHRPCPAAPLAVAPITRKEPVLFEKDILPILRRSCLACHSQSERRGDLVLETVAGMLDGGDSGPAIVPGDATKSLLFMVATHRDEPVMPPADNDVNAANLSPEELGLVGLWIDQGAKASGASPVTQARSWRPIARGFSPALAVALAADGQLVGVARGTRLLLYHPPSGRLIAELDDPELSSGAHTDLIESLAFNRDGDMLASGGFREAKIWRRPKDVRAFEMAAGGPAPVVAASPDGSLVATASMHEVKLWRGEDGGPGPTLASGADRVVAIAFAADSRGLITSDEKGRIRGWNIADGSLVGEIEVAQPARAIAFIPSPPGQDGTAVGGLLAAGGGDSTLRTYVPPTDVPARIVEQAEAGRRMAVSRRGAFVVTASQSGSTSLFENAADGSWRPLGEWTPDRGPATSVCVVERSEEGDVMLATGHADGSIGLWSPGDESVVTGFGGSGAAIRALACSEDGRVIVSGDEKGVVSTWRQEQVADPIGGVEVTSVTATAFHPAKRLVAVAGMFAGERVIVVRSVGEDRPSTVLKGYRGPVRSLAFIGDGSRLVSGGVDGWVSVWDCATLEGRQVLAVEQAGGPAVAVAGAADGTRIITAGADHVVRIWPVSEASTPRECRGHVDSVLAVGFNAAGQPFSVSADATVRTWNPDDGMQASNWTLPSAPLVVVPSSDRQTLVAVTADGSVRAHQLASGQVVKELGNMAGRPAAAAISADGGRVVTVEPTPSAAIARVYDVAGGRVIEVVPLPAAAAAYPDADGTLLRVAVDGGIARCHGHLLHRIDAGGNGVVGLAVAAGRIVAATADGSLRAYTLENGQPAGATAHGVPVSAFAMSADGGLMATGGKGGTVRFWKPDLSSIGPGITGLAADVASIGLSPDGRRTVVSVAARAAAVTVHDSATGVALQRFSGHEGIVADVAVASDSSRIVSAGDDAIWRWPLAGVAVVAGHNGVVTAIAATTAIPGELFTGCVDGIVRRVRLSDGQVIGQFSHGGPVHGVAVRPDGQRIASVGDSKSLKLWRPDAQLVVESKGDVRRNGAVTRLTRQQAAAQTQVATMKQRTEAAEKEVPARTEAANKAKAALDAAEADLKQKREMLAEADKVRITAEQAAIAASTEARGASVAKAAADRRVADLQAEIKVAQEKAALVAAAAAAMPADSGRKQAADAAAAAVTAATQTLQTMTLAAQTAAQAATAKATAANEATKRVGETQKPSTDALAAVQKSDGVLKLAMQQHAIAARELEVATAALPAARELLASAEKAVTESKTALDAATAAAAEALAPIRHVAFSPDGAFVATGGDSSSAHLWDGENGTAVTSFAGTGGALVGVAFLSPSRLVTAAATEPAAIAWDVSPRWKLDRTIGGEHAAEAPSDRVLSVDFSAESTLLLLGSGVPSRSGEVAVFDVADGTRVLHLPEAHDDVVFSARFSPDGQRIASAGADKYVRTFGVADAGRLRRFEGHTNYVLGVAWKGDGRTLASCGADGAVKIWDAETADQRVAIQPLTRHVTGIRFIGDGDTFVTGCGDRVARILNVGGGLVRAFPALEHWIHAVDVTPGGDVLAAAAADGSVRLWNATNGQVIQDLAATIPEDDADVDLGNTVGSSAGSTR